MELPEMGNSIVPVYKPFNTGVIPRTNTVGLKYFNFKPILLPIKQLPSPRVKPAVHYARVVANILCDAPCSEPLSPPTVYAEGFAKNLFENPLHNDKSFQAYINAVYGRLYRHKDVLKSRFESDVARQKDWGLCSGEYIMNETSKMRNMFTQRWDSGKGYLNDFGKSGFGNPFNGGKGFQTYDDKRFQTGGDQGFQPHGDKGFQTYDDNGYPIYNDKVHGRQDKQMGRHKPGDPSTFKETRMAGPRSRSNDPGKPNALSGPGKPNMMNKTSKGGRNSGTNTSVAHTLRDLRHANGYPKTPYNNPCHKGKAIDKWQMYDKGFQTKVTHKSYERQNRQMDPLRFKYASAATLQELDMAVQKHVKNHPGKSNNTLATHSDPNTRSKTTKGTHHNQGGTTDPTKHTSGTHGFKKSAAGTESGTGLIYDASGKEISTQKDTQHSHEKHNAGAGHVGGEMGKEMASTGGHKPSKIHQGKMGSNDALSKGSLVPGHSLKHDKKSKKRPSQASVGTEDGMLDVGGEHLKLPSLMSVHKYSQDSRHHIRNTNDPLTLPHIFNEGMAPLDKDDPHYRDSVQSENMEHGEPRKPRRSRLDSLTFDMDKITQFTSYQLPGQHCLPMITSSQCLGQGDEVNNAASNPCWEMAAKLFKTPLRAPAIPLPENLVIHIEKKFSCSLWPRGCPIATRYYPSGQPFCVVFENGAGRVHYPHGGLAIAISAPARNDALLLTGASRVLVIRDPFDLFYFFDKAIMADLSCSGNGVVFDENGIIKVQYNALEGYRQEGMGKMAQRWQWNTGGQRIIIKLNRYIALKIMDLTKIYLVFYGNKRGVRLNVGAGRRVNLMSVAGDSQLNCTVPERPIEPCEAFDYTRGTYIAPVLGFLDKERQGPHKTCATDIGCPESEPPYKLSFGDCNLNQNIDLCESQNCYVQGCCEDAM